VNPLAVLRDGSVLALDCKLAVDDASLTARSGRAGLGSPERLTGWRSAPGRST
jgi:succinyl-CoA synthetase beta subunit